MVYIGACIDYVQSQHLVFSFSSCARGPGSASYVLPNEGAGHMFPQLAQFTDIGLLLLRLMAGLVFVSSGWKHLNDPAARSKSIGMSKGFTIFLGAAEVAGGLGVSFGVLTQLAALGLILLMLGAIQKKIFVWHTGFWGEKSFGWHYDLIFIIMTLVIAFTNGGRFVLDQYLPFFHL
jgi:putative oxidoreductase